jgi:hypothetical protein
VVNKAAEKEPEKFAARRPKIATRPYWAVVIG